MVSEQRRRFLTLLAVGGAAGFAGCSSDDGGGRNGNGNGNGGNGAGNSGNGNGNGEGDEESDNDAGNADSEDSEDETTRDPPDTPKTWPQRYYDAANTGFIHETTVTASDQFETAWRFERETQGENFEPVLGDGVAVQFISMSTTGPEQAGGIYAVDMDSGELLWEDNLEGSRTGLAMVEGTVFAADTGDTGLRAFDAATGDVRWTNPDAQQSLTVKDGTVYAGLDTDSFGFGTIAVDASDGSERWSTSRGGTRTMDDEALYLESGGDIAALDPDDGSVLWENSVEADSSVTTQSASAVANDTYVVPGANGTLYTFDTATGEKRWTQQVFDGADEFSEALGRPCIGQDTVYVGGDGQSVYAYSLADGSQQWTYSLPAGGGRRIFYDGDSVIYTTLDFIEALDPADGTQKWRWERGSDISQFGHPIFTDEAIYTGLDDAILVKLDP